MGRGVDTKGINSRLLIALLVGALCFTVTSAMADTAAGLSISRNLRYAPHDYGTLDVYRPARADPVPRPVIIFWHGGSWQSGSKDNDEAVGKILAGQGFVAVLPDYRLYPQVRIEGFMDDAARAVAFVRTHAREWDGDPSRIVVSGYSAGGHIAAMIALDDRWLSHVSLSTKQIAGFVGFAGAYDFLPHEAEEYGDIFGPPTQHARSQPVYHVSADAPPSLILQGLADRVVRPREARSLVNQLRAAGAQVESHYYKSVGHQGMLNALEREQGSSAPVLADVTHFVRALPPRD